MEQMLICLSLALIAGLLMSRAAKAVRLPAVTAYRKELAKTTLEVRDACADADTSYESDLVRKLSGLTSMAYQNVNALQDCIETAKSLDDLEQAADYYKDKVIGAMSALRAVVDQMELVTSKKYWPYPSYGEMLFSVR